MAKSKRCGIVGSRRRECESEVRDLVRSFPKETIVVSGGARGPDAWAEDEAKKLKLATVIFLPSKKGTGYQMACRALTERNKMIAQSVDILYAFVAPDRKGGTEQTIKFAKKAGVEVVLL
jgi:predicted Rossmann fold nucleotide-binding protein DprA/Smf involved in DNA uptake